MPKIKAKFYMKIGLLGCGVIGYGVYDIINNSEFAFSKDLEVVKALVKTPEEITMDFMTNDVDSIIANKDIDTVVEVMGGIHPAYEFITTAIKNGKNIVTANKAVVAAHYEEFVKLAKENGVSFKYEASVGGGIPWIKALRQAMRIDSITRIGGIMNGTTNYILSTMEAEHIDFDVCLRSAQQKGYAEANPSADIDGIDVRNKLVISSSLAYSNYTPAENIPTMGIRNIALEDLDYFASIGKSVRLYADSVRSGGKYACRIEPTLFDKSTAEAATLSNNNIFSLNGGTIGELKFIGQGAGRYPTANAIVQDIIDILTDDHSMVNESFCANLTYDEDLLVGSYYVRAPKDDALLTALAPFCPTEIKGSKAYLVKDIPSAKLHNALKDIDGVFFARI